MYKEYLDVAMDRKEPHSYRTTTALVAIALLLEEIVMKGNQSV